MSMYRQLWLAIIVSMFLALCGSLLASLLSARAYLEHQLSMKNADNAAALALSLSQQKPDTVAIELGVSALFDSGHYESISVHDPNGKLIIERKSEAGDIDVPDWFVKLIPIHPDPGEAQITNGWSQLGVVTLVSHSRFGYQAVWASTQRVVAALLLASLIGGYLGSLILRRLKKPLAAVIDQAVAITKRRFITIPKPDVPELNQLAEAMNLTVTRIKRMFEEEATRLDAVRREANHDSLTGLANRDRLLAELRSAIGEEGSSGGVLFLIRVADLVGINRRMGREATDDMLRRVGQALAESSAELPESTAARMNGADFALLMKGQHDGAQTAETLLARLVAATEPFVEKSPSAYIAYGRFRFGTLLGAVLSQVDAALIAVEAEGKTGCREAVFDDANDLPENGEEWARAISQSVVRDQIKLVQFPVIDNGRKLLHYECPLRLRTDPHGNWLAAGRFLPIAERLGLVKILDLAALSQGLKQLGDGTGDTDLAINLSATTLSDPAFPAEIDALLKAHRKLARKLWIEVAETGVFKHLDAFRTLCHLLEKYECRVGIEHFGRQLSEIGRLHDLGLNYVKIDSSFVKGLDTNPGNQAFLKGTCTMARNMGMLVLAEGVETTAELEVLFSLGFDGATGPGVTLPSSA